MPRYEVQLSRLVREWRVITVEVSEDDPKVARRRALAIARGDVERASTRSRPFSGLDNGSRIGYKGLTMETLIQILGQILVVAVLFGTILHGGRDLPEWLVKEEPEGLDNGKQIGDTDPHENLGYDG